MGPKKKKQKDTGFMTDEERDEEEEAKKRAEQERLERERLQKEMEEELRRAKAVKKKREKNEMHYEEFKNQVLQDHCSLFRRFMSEYMDYLIEKRGEKEWQVYVSCNHLPFANDPRALNTFLYTWILIEDKLNMNNVLKESEIILESILPVEEYIDSPLNMKETTVNDLKEVKVNYYNQVLKNIDKVTFDAIMDVGKYHKQIEPSQIEIYQESKHFMFWMWAWAIEGRSEGRPKKKRPERDLPMMSITLPGILEVKRYHLRIFYTTFDPYSFRSESCKAPYIDIDTYDLYEENLNMRKIEIQALKAHFMYNYDEDIIPWWYLMDKEIMEERAKRELLKKPKIKKKKAGNIVSSDSALPTDASKSEKIEITSEETEAMDVVSEKGRISRKQYDSEVYDSEVEIQRVPVSKEGSTHIIYSRSMCDLMEKRRYECQGPEYFSEVDPIEYLEHSNTLSSGSTKDRYKDLFKTEKHTTFKAFMYAEDEDLSDGVILRDINDCLNRSDPSDEKLSFTDKRVFLDWKSLRDISPDREAIREELEEMLFGNNEMILDNGQIKCVKRNSNLRSLKELLAQMQNNKDVERPSLDHQEEREKEQNVVNIQQPADAATKVSNVSEMRELEIEIANIADMAWQENLDNYVRKMIMDLDPSEINLRQMAIVGGVFQFDFFEDEPQPHVNKECFKTQLHYGEYKLKRILFDQIPKVRIDLAAEVERQMNLAKRQKSLRKMSRLTFSGADLPAEDTDSVVLGDDDLVWISLKLPKQVVYFGSPVAVRWNSEKMFWTTDDVYDLKWNENKHLCNFKLGKSGPFAIAINRFCNLPYFNFCLKPSSDWKKNSEIELRLTTRNFPITFKIKEHTITIKELDINKADSISHIINVPFTFEDLVVNMRACGIDLFPEWDSFLYINISLKKLRSLEEHMYYCMAFSAPAFEYASSFHNATNREDRIYVQIRECVEKNASASNYRTLVASPRKIYFVNQEKLSLHPDENEESEVINYMPDLKHLVETIASKKALRRMKKISKSTVGTLNRLLAATRILCFS